MKNKASVWSLLKPKKLRVVLSLGLKGYLEDKGWFAAFENQKPIDERGNPVPWVTYSFIDFIKNRINKEHDIFEFGSGNSTLFYSKFANKVTAVEHDKSWYKRLISKVTGNVDLIYCTLDKDGDYCRAALNTQKKFHIIIVDGRDRVNCCRQAMASLTDDGVIVLDDSERKEYNEAHEFMQASGFKNIPFSGMAPGVIISKCTTVFYKPTNCLGI